MVREVRIDADWVRRYCVLCGHDPESSLTPILFPQVLAFPLLLHYFASPDCPWSALGVVHLGNDIVASRGLCAGEAFDVSVESGALTAHPKGQVFTVTSRLAEGGVEVWRVTQTLLRLGVKAPVGPAWNESHALGGPAEGDANPSGRSSGGRTDGHRYPDSEGVALLRVAEFDAPVDIGRRYAPVSGDFNPIHLTGWSARLLGFDRPIAHGMWTLARALAVLGIDRVDGRHRLQTVFGSPVRLPARVSVWSAGNDEGLSFEVRDLAGERVHVRGRIIASASRV